MINPETLEEEWRVALNGKDLQSQIQKTVKDSRLALFQKY